jgi:hypothetical protein
MLSFAIGFGLGVVAGHVFRDRISAWINGVYAKINEGR